jgi:broad specificity phosphatase PhoE
MQTAVLAADTSLFIHTLEVFPELEELDQGIWEGKKRAEIYTEEKLKEIKEDPYNFAAPNGESQKDVAERVDALIQKFSFDAESLRGPFSKTYWPTPCAVFCHGIVIKAWLYHFMKFRHELVYPMTIDNCSITRIKRNHDTWDIKCINYTPEAVKRA